jgi:tetratricopeptide (TPR) repeat protein
VDSPAAVGRRIRAQRARRGLRQADLAFEGCTAAYISRIEAGARIPSLQLIEEFAKRLGVSSAFLARGEEEPAEAVALADAQLAQHLGELDAAREGFDRLVASDEPGVRKAALLGLGQLTLLDGDLDRAIELLEEHDRLSANDRPIDPAGAEALAHAYSTRGDLATAVGMLERKLAVVDGDDIARSRLAVILANALIDLGEFQRAEAMIGGSIADLSSPPNPIALARCLWSQSRLHVARGDSDLALRYAEDALSLIRATEHDEYAAKAHQLVAFIELERGNAERALELLEQALPLVERGGNRTLVAVFRLERARALAALGDFDEASSVAAELLCEIDLLSHVDAARSLAVLAAISAKAGDTERALELYEAAADQIAGRENVPMLVRLYAEWSDLLAEVGQVDKAFEVARRALGARQGRQPTL